jgi:HNH endonuclease.
MPATRHAALALDAPSPAVPPKSGGGFDASQVLHSVWSGIWSAASASPWLAALLALVVVGSIVRGVRFVIHSGPRDPVRRFPTSFKREIVRRAGGRCEHHSLLFGRCRSTRDLEADHVHPHSRGGWTNIANGQALCRRHNRLKRASVPFGFQLRALERRRARYFPSGVGGAVIRRGR